MKRQHGRQYQLQLQTFTDEDEKPIAKCLWVVQCLFPCFDLYYLAFLGHANLFSFIVTNEYV